VIEHLFAVVGVLGVTTAGGSTWLLVREDKTGRRRARARRVRLLTTASVAVVVATALVLRPWYWDLAISAVVGVGAAAVHRILPSLENRGDAPAGWRVIALAMVTVVLASGVVTVAGIAALLDGAAMGGGRPVPVAHDGQVLDRPVLYELFWGPAWAGPKPPAAVLQAATFDRSAPGSAWARDLAGFGVESLSAGGCWIDPAPTPPGPVASMSSGAFPAELHRAFSGSRHLTPCPGSPAVAVPRALAPDALVAVWLGPQQTDALGGLSAHGAVPWPGRADGVAAAGITGGFAFWGSSSCPARPDCRAIPAFATPAYALSHEVVEAITNPYGHGWYADAPVQWSARYFLSHGPSSMFGAAPVFQGEVADLCEPGQPDASSGPPGPTAGSGGLTFAAYYRLGVGCTW
jgi:hypothetical protein